MTKHHFSFKEVFMFGWNKTKQHAWFIFLTTIIISIVCSSVQQSHYFIGEKGRIVDMFAPTPLSVVVLVMILLSLVSISLSIARNHSFTFTDLVSPLLSPRKVLKFFALSAFFSLPALLLSLAVALTVTGISNQIASVTIFGFIVTLLLFVPSLYVLVRFKFFPFVVIENENDTVSELIKKSYKITANNFWPLFMYILLAGIFNLIGAMLLGIGLFVTIPITMFATAYLYDRFKNHYTLG